MDLYDCELATFHFHNNMANFLGHVRAFMGDVSEINQHTIVPCMDRLWNSTCLSNDNNKFLDIATDILRCLLDNDSIWRLAHDVGIYRLRYRPEKAITLWYISTNIE